MTTQPQKTEVGSYFISNYPPFSVWNEEAVTQVMRVFNAPPADVPLGLYLHIPFCRKRCKFCYFRVYTDKRADEIESYLAALENEIKLVSALPVIGNRPIRFVYFGGGTPSFLSVKQLRSLFGRLRQHIQWDKAEEVTFECEPGTLSEPKVRALQELGVTRLSLGVENFNDEILEENGRAHKSPEVFKAWDWIAAAGFPNVNIDLISGMVGETWDNWRDCIQRTIAMSPDSVTIYQMELPFNTVYSKDILQHDSDSPVANWQTKRDWVDYAFSELIKVGYHVSSAYTVVKNPDQVNFSYRDNLWQGSDLLATGVASFGHISGVHYQNHPNWNEYVEMLQQERLPICRGLVPTPDQLLIRELVLQLKRGYLDAGYFQAKYNVNVLERFRSQWEALAADGLLSVSGDIITLSRPGLLCVDGLLPSFFEPEHQGVRYT